MSKIIKALKSIKSSLINDSFSLTYDKNLYKLTNEYFQLIRELIQKYNSKKIKPKDSNLKKISFPKNINYKTLIMKKYWIKYFHQMNIFYIYLI